MVKAEWKSEIFVKLLEKSKGKKTEIEITILKAIFIQIQFYFSFSTTKFNEPLLYEMMSLVKR